MRTKLATTITALAIADAITTWHLLSIPGYEEGNPVANILMDTVGVLPVITAATILHLALAAAVTRCRGTIGTAITIAATIITTGKLAVVTNNLWLLVTN